MNGVVPEKLSERTIEVNFIRRLAHCLEECRGVDRDDIVPLSPTQQDEAEKGYDALLDGLYVALQFKRPHYMEKGCAKFEVDSCQAHMLKGNFPRGAAFYVLPPVGDLKELVGILPRMLDATYIVDVHELFPNDTPCNGHSCTLWIDYCGRITVYDSGFRNGFNAALPPFSCPVSGRRRLPHRTLNALKSSVLCDKKPSKHGQIGFHLRAGKLVPRTVPGPKPENGRHHADEHIDERLPTSADTMHAAKDTRSTLVRMGNSDKQEG